MITSDNVKSVLPVMTIKELATVDYSFNHLFCVQIAERQPFFASKVVRILPGKRLVAFGVWENKTVVAKFFFDKKNASRHLKNEIAGSKVLQSREIPTPAIYYEGICSDRQMYVVIYEQIIGAESLADLFAKTGSLSTLMPQLLDMIVELATQHVMGVLQNDLHFKNFLFADNKIYSLDGDRVTLSEQPLSKQDSMDHLALFCSQLGVLALDYQQQLFQHYVKQRSWIVSQKDELFFLKLIEKWYEKRWHKYQKKIMRNSSHYVSFRAANLRGMYDRAYANNGFLNLLAYPDTAFDHPSAKLLKAGNSSTVVRVKINDKYLVVKRYNMKNWRHFLRRCFRQTRAAHAWMMANKMKLFNLPVAKPVAYVEHHFFGLRHISYYISEYLDGDNIEDYLIKSLSHEDIIDEVAFNVEKLMQGMLTLNLTHGDLKATNILINDQGKPAFIDLDATKEYSTLTSLRKSYQKDCLRLLENFKAYPTILQKFQAIISPS